VIGAGHWATSAARQTQGNDRPQALIDRFDGSLNTALPERLEAALGRLTLRCVSRGQKGTPLTVTRLKRGPLRQDIAIPVLVGVLVGIVCVLVLLKVVGVL
jgi:hypothetical protein